MVACCFAAAAVLYKRSRKRENTPAAAALRTWEVVCVCGLCRPQVESCFRWIRHFIYVCNDQTEEQSLFFCDAINGRRTERQRQDRTSGNTYGGSVDAFCRPTNNLRI